MWFIYVSKNFAIVEYFYFLYEHESWLHFKYNTMLNADDDHVT